ncbi:MAG: Mth938-like domain-containing protein [Pseudomonadota bacterium]
MEITPNIPQDRQVIESYGEGRFRISGAPYTGSVLVFPDRTIAWPVSRMEDISVGALSGVLDAEPRVEILLVGCGERLVPLSEDLRGPLREKGIGCDAMDTGAACRTFNILLAESRRVAAALIAL